MKILDKFMEYFNKLLMATGVVFLIGVCIFCTTQVVCRFILKVGVGGTEELTRFCFTWMTCMCAGLCVKDGTNPSISIFRDALTGKAQVFCDLLIHLTVITLGVMFIVLGVPYVESSAAAKFGVLPISVGYLHASIIFAGIGITVNAVNNIIHFIAQLVKPGVKTEEKEAAES